MDVSIDDSRDEPVVLRHKTVTDVCSPACGCVPCGHRTHMSVRVLAGEAATVRSLKQHMSSLSIGLTDV